MGQSDDDLAREAILLLADVIGAIAVGTVHLLGSTQVEELLEKVAQAQAIAKRIDRARGAKAEGE